ncbi:MAG: addiction module protein [Candidatus Scalindua sp.]
MAINIKEITKAALEFPPIERAKLIEDLFESFESRSRNLIDKRWAEETEDRIDAFVPGKIETVSAEQVHREINQMKVK